MDSLPYTVYRWTCTATHRAHVSITKDADLSLTFIRFVNAAKGTPRERRSALFWDLVRNANPARWQLHVFGDFREEWEARKKAKEVRVETEKTGLALYLPNWNHRRRGHRCL